MRLIQITPGTGNYYCGHCLRDNALALALRARGHDVVMVPMYLPAVTDEVSASDGVPMFFGGINVYLEGKSSLFRRLPAAVTRFLDTPALLRKTAAYAGMTSARDLGALTVSMLRGEEGHQARELRRLIDWLKSQPPADVVCLSTGLLAGLARQLTSELGVPVVCALQGEDGFLDSLTDPYREQAWDLIKQRAQDVARFVAVSHYYGELMRARLGLAGDRVTVVYNGINLDGYTPATRPPQPAAIGYLAKMSPAKGLDRVVRAFRTLKHRGRIPGLMLRIAGAQTSSDNAFVRSLADQLAADGLTQDVEWLPNIDRATKQEFLRRINVLSVPATYGEAFGLYLLEAWAAAVPVVQPRRGAFPELIERSGGGLLYQPDDDDALADTLETLLLDPERAQQLGRQARDVVREQFSVERMAQNVDDVLTDVVQRHGLRI